MKIMPVPSVMKLLEKLTDEEVDEMILETDVDDTQCSEQIVDVPVAQIAERIVEVVTNIPRGRIPERGRCTDRPDHTPTTSRCTDRQHVRTHTQSDGEDRQRF